MGFEEVSDVGRDGHLERVSPEPWWDRRPRQVVQLGLELACLEDGLVPLREEHVSDRWLMDVVL